MHLINEENKIIAMKSSIPTASVLVVISLAAGFMLYPKMPGEMASHWNMEGKADGYAPKIWGLYMLPALTAIMLVFFSIIPCIDPLKKNIQAFRNHYEDFIVVFTAFMLYVHALTLAWNYGIAFDMRQMLSPAFGALIYFAGILTGNAKRNWFIGIRTPWTLSSEQVWEKTHKIGGRLFKIAGVIALLGFILPEYALWLVLAPVLATAAYTFIYSYLEYRKNDLPGS
ncbi:MAG: SdpI family protein [Candidatus Altiarchaeota archaeon]|nr:SdpI family protein [Candidatus Altiarchaeota archaeon]